MEWSQFAQGPKSEFLRMTWKENLIQTLLTLTLSSAENFQNSESLSDL